MRQRHDRASTPARLTSPHVERTGVSDTDFKNALDPISTVIGGIGVVAIVAGRPRRKPARRVAVTLAAQTAFNRVHGVPHRERPNFLMARARGVLMLTVLGALQLVSTAASGLVTGGVGGPLLLLAGIALSLALNAVLFIAGFRLLTDSSVPTSELWPGIIAATVLWTAVQAVGGAYISHVVKGAGTTYGTYATVIGLLTWLFLGAASWSTRPSSTRCSPTSSGREGSWLRSSPPTAAP